MPTAPEGSTSGPGNYIRASAGSTADAGRVIRFIIALCALVLAVLVIVTTIGASRQNSVQARLQRDGVPVVITVTFCEGVSSGIGQAIVYYHCKGDYTLGGHTYNEVIGGNTAVHPLGQKLQGVAVPGHPALLSTATAVAKKFSRWTPYVTPIVLAAAFIALALVLLVWSRRRTRSPATRQEASTANPVRSL